MKSRQRIYVGITALIVLLQTIAFANASSDLALGDQYLQDKAYRNALVHYHAALKDDPASLSAQIGLAKTYYKTGRYDLEKHYYDMVLQADPQNPEALIYTCKHLLSEARYTEAETILLQLSVNDITRIRALNQLAVLYGMTGRSVEADALYEELKSGNQ